MLYTLIYITFSSIICPVEERRQDRRRIQRGRVAADDAQHAELQGRVAGGPEGALHPDHGETGARHRAVRHTDLQQGEHMRPAQYAWCCASD